MFIVVLYICFCVYVCVCFLSFSSLAQVFEMDSDTAFFCAVFACVCVSYATKLSFSRKTKIVRLKHITYFVFFFFFSVLFHCSQPVSLSLSLFLSMSIAFYSRKNYASPFVDPIRFSLFSFFILLLLLGLMMIMYMVCIL